MILCILAWWAQTISGYFIKTEGIFIWGDYGPVDGNHIPVVPSPFDYWSASVNYYFSGSIRCYRIISALQLYLHGSHSLFGIQGSHSGFFYNEMDLSVNIFRFLAAEFSRIAS